MSTKNIYKLRNNFSVIVNGKRQYYHYKFSAFNACRIYGLTEVRSERTKKITYYYL